MKNAVADFLEKYFPARAESANNRLGVLLDRAIYFFIFLTVLAAPISIAATNIGWISGFALWIVRLFVRPRPPVFRSALDFPLMAWFAWTLVSCFFSYAPDLSFDRLRVSTLFPIAYLIAQNIRREKTVKLLAGAMLFSCLATVAWTFLERIPGRGVQVFGVREQSALAAAGVRDGDTLLRANGKKFSTPEELAAALRQNDSIKLQYYRPDWYFEEKATGDKLANGSTANEQLGFSEWKRSRNWRSAGFYSHYTTYAEVLQLIISLAAGLFTARLYRKKAASFSEDFSRSPFPTLIFAVCLAAMCASLLLTGTRASQAAFLVSAFAIVALGANRKMLLALTALALPVIVVGAIYLQQSRNVGYVDQADTSTTWRMTVYRESLELLTSSPRHLIVGVGIGSINRFRCEWGMFDNCKLPPGHLHSTPLQIAVDTGLPALFLWFFVLFRYGKILLSAIGKQSVDWIEKGILLGAFGGLIGFFTSGAVHYNLGDSEVAMVFYIIMGFALVLTRETEARA